MSQKRIQTKHWQNSSTPCPHKTRLDWLYARAGMMGKESDTTGLRIFRLEIEYRNKR